MCEPVSIASGVLGGMSAIGSHQSGVNAASAKNKASARSYKQQLLQRDMDWQSQLNQWDVKNLNYTRELRASNNALGRAYAQEQMKMDEAYDKVAFQNQAAFMKLADARGKIGAKGVSGKTKQRIDASALAAFGRNQAIQAETLASSSYAMDAKNEDNRLKAMGHNNKLYSEVTFAPVEGAAPVKPVMESGPSPLSLVAGLGQAGLGAYNMYQDSLKIPSGEKKPG